MKLICRKTGETVTTFQILMKNVCHTREFINVGEGTVVEFDREYFDGGIKNLVYTTKSGEHVIECDPTEIPTNLFLIELQRESMRFDITSEMIEESKTTGPFIIEGGSRIINIGD
jgi:hypothetical protein